MFLISKDYWEIRDTKHKGKGVFTKRTIPARTIIGDYVGDLIKLANVDYDKEKENMYLMYYDNALGIYPDLSKPGIHLLNHSCSPNCWIYNLKNHTVVFALKDIKKEEELTISYLLPPKVDCKNCPHDCYCGSALCIKTMHLSEEKYKIWQNFLKINVIRKKEKNKESKLKPLIKYPKQISSKYVTKIKNLGIIS